jgi:RecA-family ATPase
MSSPNEPALYITCEDDADQLHWRQSQICAGLGVNMESLADRLHLVSRRGHAANALCTFEKDVLRETAEYRALAKTVGGTGAKLVFLDNIAHLFPGNENHRGQVTQFVSLLSSLANETGAGIVLIGHTNKSFGQGNEQGNQFSGSTAWPNAVRSQATLVNDPKTALRKIRADKANYAEQGKETCFYWADGYFRHQADMSDDVGRAIALRQRAARDDTLYLACLRERMTQKRAVSEKKNAPTYAPTTFSKMPESENIGKERLEEAQERLWRARTIERGGLPWTDGARHAVEGIREVVHPGTDSKANASP